MSPDIFSVAAAGLGGLLGAMYLDAKCLLSSDLKKVKNALSAQLGLRKLESQGQVHSYYRFKEKAKQFSNDIFVIFEGKEYTFHHIEKASNRLAHWLLAQNIKKGDVVCMMHQNHPTFIILLLAISKIGGIPSLVNTNLTDHSLLHCIKMAYCKMFIFDPVYERQVVVNLDEYQKLGIDVVAYGEHTEESELSPLPFGLTLNPSILVNYSDEDTSEEFIKGVSFTEPAYLIYTSGTTGLPKAAIVQHLRVYGSMAFLGKTARIKKDSRVYCVLPMYHSSGLLVSFSSTLHAGGTFVLGRKFSASRFWKDCVNYKVNVFTYIGEFCRYLLSQPPRPEEKRHQVKVIYGNGMRPDVWERFRERFNIPTFCEFYSATEAPSSMINVNTSELGAGAVGSRGLFIRLLQSEIQIIKIDPVTEEPIRDKNGLCIKCGYEEKGELVVRIQAQSTVVFDGYYKNKEATQKKILSNVLQKGDLYFRSGDLLSMNSDGFYYFSDRLGDTFRWKSENVATTEVAQVLGEYPEIAEANVYGTLVPNHDGRAGMAAIVLKQGVTIDFKDLYHFLHQRLPKYAIPLFIRFIPAMEITGTFKHQKVHFRNQGIDLTQIPKSEPVYWHKNGTYVPFTLEDYAKINTGQAKL